MSRHPVQQGILCSQEQCLAEHYVNAVASTAVPILMLIEEVQQETAKDTTLQAVISMIRNKWHDLMPYHDGGVDPGVLQVYSRVKDEVNETGDLVLRDYRIVLPQSLQQRAVELAHEGHQGTCSGPRCVSQGWTLLQKKQ